VIATALIIGLDQIGIDVALLVALAVVAFAAPVISLALAFGLGARRYAGNLIGARTARSHLSVGLRVRIGDVEGEVLEIMPTQIALNTDAGKVLVPAGYMDEQLVTIMAPAREQASPDV